jgi:hypothetical protein
MADKVSGIKVGSKPFKAKKPFFAPLPVKKVPLKPVKRLPQKPKEEVKKAEPKKKTEDKKTSRFSLEKPFQELAKTSQKYQKHKPIGDVASETKQAGILPSVKANKVVAEKHQVDVMDEQAKDKKGFDKGAFEKKLKDEIYKTIKNKEDAKRVKENGKVDDSVGETISESLAEEKSKSGGGMESSTITPPAKPSTPSDERTSEEPGKLIAEKPDSKTLTTHKAKLAPVARPASETDFSKETQTLDDDYAQHNLSKEKLQNSDEPSFIAADNQKQDSQDKAAELTKQTRQGETKTISGAQKVNITALNKNYQEMLNKQSETKKGRFDQQKKKSDEETKIREDVAKQLDGIFKDTNDKVQKCFADLDTYINVIFSGNLTRSLEKFSTRSAELLDEYSDTWASIGSFFGVSEYKSEAEVFEIAKKEFLRDMEKPTSDLVTAVDKLLTEANDAIAEGKKKRNEFWDKQSGEVKRIAKEVFDESGEKFTELETEVKSKENSVIETVSQKFEEAMNQLDERFAKAVEENKSWLDKAIDAVKGVIKTILELKAAIEKLAAKIAAYADRIIDAPGEFFSNLVDGVGQGFTNFKNNIGQHLAKGVIEWLTGAMEGTEIQIPKDLLSLNGITSLILQILGITIQRIKQLLIDAIGEKRFQFIENGVDKAISAGNKILEIFVILKTQGLAGLWEFIKDEFNDLKEMFIETVKGFVIETITKKAIEFLLSLLIPGAGFIKAIQLLIKFVITLFQNAGRIIKIIDGIVDTFGDVLNKNLGSVITRVENVFSGFLSLAITFLAAVLGLDGIAAKVRKFIQTKVRPKIDKALNAVAKKLKMVADKIGLAKLIDKSMNAVQKGKNWVEEKKQQAIDAGKAGLGKVAEWLGIKKTYTSKDGNTHTLSVEEVNGKPTLMRASVKGTFEAYYAKIAAAVSDYNIRNPNSIINLGPIKKEYDNIHDYMSKYDQFENKGVSKSMNDLAKLLAGLPDEFKELNVFFPPKEIISQKAIATKINGVDASEDGHEINIKNLSLKLGDDLIGSPGEYTSKLYNHLHSQMDGILIRGHLLNHYLGGTGNSKENITPIPKVTNDTMERTSEDVVKERLAKLTIVNGGVFDYYVKVEYANSTDFNADVPSIITMRLITKQFKLTKPEEKTKENMLIASNWEAAPGQLSERRITDVKDKLELLKK